MAYPPTPSQRWPCFMGWVFLVLFWSLSITFFCRNVDIQTFLHRTKTSRFARFAKTNGLVHITNGQLAATFCAHLFKWPGWYKLNQSKVYVMLHSQLLAVTKLQRIVATSIYSESERLRNLNMGFCFSNWKHFRQYIVEIICRVL